MVHGYADHSRYVEEFMTGMDEQVKNHWIDRIDSTVIKDPPVTNERNDSHNLCQFPQKCRTGCCPLGIDP
jgi:hypothetical protein